VKPTASTSTEGIEDTDDDVLWIQWPASDESEAVGHGDASDRSIDQFGSIDKVDGWLLFESGCESSRIMLGTASC
jgi:hypothetical protein